MCVGWGEGRRDTRCNELLEAKGLRHCVVLPAVGSVNSAPGLHGVCRPSPSERLDVSARHGSDAQAGVTSSLQGGKPAVRSGLA